MLYCPACKDMFSDDYTFCPVCGAKKIRPVEAGDPVFLITKQGVWADVTEEVLHDNHIPFLKQTSAGSNAMGFILDAQAAYDYYVPYASFEQAADFMRMLFENPSQTEFDGENDEG